MSEQFITNVIRLIFGAVAAAAVGLAPVTWAAEVNDDNKIDLSNLIFFKGDAYSVTYEDNVSREATSQTTVRKIAYGETSIVNIITTTSGVYSSDGMTSPHILYPGVHVEQVPIEDTDDQGLYKRPRLEGSFVNIVRTPKTLIVQGNRANCVVTKSTLMC